jgi:hypothetical protein
MITSSPSVSRVLDENYVGLPPAEPTAHGREESDMKLEVHVAEVEREPSESAVWEIQNYQGPALRRAGRSHRADLVSAS